MKNRESRASVPLSCRKKFLFDFFSAIDLAEIAHLSPICCEFV
jgi:hypothetical protein